MIDLIPVFETKLGKLFNEDALEVMEWMKKNKITANMIFADCPYAIGKAEWDKFTPEEYLNWSKKWISKSCDVLSENGTLFVMGFSETLADIKYIVTRGDIGFKNCRWLVWHYRNKPSLGKNDWVRSHESILHFRKKKKFTFNMDSIREPYNVHTLTYPERAQGVTSQYGNGNNKYNEQTNWSPNGQGAKPRDVFIIPAICNQTPERVKHPTQKPEELLRKLILATTNEGDIVYDPFGGSGTTYAVCEQLNRRWFGSELDKEYCQIISERIKKIPQKSIDYWISIDEKRNAHRAKVRGVRNSH